MLNTLSGLDQEKCRRRNRLSALRYGIETVDLELSREHPMPKGAKPDFVRGMGPKDNADALRMINALQPEGSTPLTEADVHLLPVMQAANTNFIGDRYMFLGSSTLRNIQRDAEDGFAFMNSHRTGALSTPSELPFGRTYAGRYERYQPGVTPKGLARTQSSNSRPFERTQLWVYMLRNEYPNGPNGPSTDTLARQIDAGILHDVSMGLHGGARMCDVCANELRSENCNHVPATGHNVTPEQKRTQEARGVPKGHASYTLEDAHSGEVSGVYDGAVPGAGFSKALSYYKMGSLQGSDIDELVRVYAPLLAKGDFGMENLNDENIDTELEAIEVIEAELTPAITAPSESASTSQVYIGTTTVPNTNFSGTVYPVGGVSGSAVFTQVLHSEPSREEQLSRQNEELQARLDALEAEKRSAEALEVSDQIIADKHIFEAGRPALECLAMLLADEDVDGATFEFKDNLGKPYQMSRLELLEQVFMDVPQHSLFADHELTALPEGAVLLKGELEHEDRDVLSAKEDARRVIERSRPKATIKK